MADNTEDDKKTSKRRRRTPTTTKAKADTTPDTTPTETKSTESPADSTRPKAVLSGVQSGIEMPKLSTGRNAEYDFDEMNVGDMFFIDPDKKQTVSSAARRHVLANPLEDGMRKRFVCRDFPADSEHAGKAGCWRLDDVQRKSKKPADAKPDPSSDEEI